MLKSQTGVVNELGIDSFDITFIGLVIEPMLGTSEIESVLDSTLSNASDVARKNSCPEWSELRQSSVSLSLNLITCARFL